MIFFHGKSDSGGGVLIAFHEDVNYKITEQYVESNGRYIMLNVLLDNVPLILVNYYYKADQLNLLEELSHIFDQLDTAENTTLL